MIAKNARARRVRNRTSSSKCPETTDRRVRRTTSSLHDALIGLAREKPYDDIAVKEILHRADVGRSTFYTHFGDKDDLLESSIEEIVRDADDVPQSADAIEWILAFSLPVLEHIDRHRHASGPQMGRHSRVAIHQRLGDMLTQRIADDVDRVFARHRSASSIPVTLVARHLASTFVLTLNWWIECEPMLRPADVDETFRSLVVPTLVALIGSDPKREALG